MLGPMPPQGKQSGLPPHLDALYQVLGTQKKAMEAKMKLAQILRANGQPNYAQPISPVQQNQQNYQNPTGNPY